MSDNDWDVIIDEDLYEDPSARQRGGSPRSDRSERSNGQNQHSVRPQNRSGSWDEHNRPLSAASGREHDRNSIPKSPSAQGQNAPRPGVDNSSQSSRPTQNSAASVSQPRADSARREYPPLKYGQLRSNFSEGQKAQRPDARRPEDYRHQQNAHRQDAGDLEITRRIPIQKRSQNPDERNRVGGAGAQAYNRSGGQNANEVRPQRSPQPQAGEAARRPDVRSAPQPRPRPEDASARRDGNPSGASGERGNEPVRRRPYTGCLTGIVYFMFVVGVSALLAGLIWVSANEVLALNKPEKTVTVTIGENDEMSDITNTLYEAGVVNYRWLFNLYAGVSNAQAKIKPGTYEIRTNYDYMAIVNSLKPTAGPKESVEVVVPEGFTLRQIFERLVEKKVCTMEELEATARDYDFDYKFLKDLPKTDKRLEGYLFPDTYEFYVNDKPENVLGKMLKNFDNKFTEEMVERAAEMGYTVHEIVTIASMIEREAATHDEGWTIASVIYNRLNSSSFPFLQIDATVQYCLPEHKERLTNDDLKIDNPYNTYAYEGLPPGPIASPGESSLGAALYPDDTNYYYYAVNKDGVHQFSRNKDEHDAIVAAAREARDE